MGCQLIAINTMVLREPELPDGKSLKGLYNRRVDEMRGTPKDVK